MHPVDTEIQVDVAGTTSDEKTRAEWDSDDDTGSFSQVSSSASQQNSPADVAAGDQSVAEADESQYLPPPLKPFRYQNTYLWLLKLLKQPVQHHKEFQIFFASELRRRVVITVALLFLTRVGLLLPLPGFDRMRMPAVDMRARSK